MVRLVVYSLIGASLLAALPHYISDFQASRHDARQAQATGPADDTRLATARLDTREPATNLTASYAAGPLMRLAPDEQGHFSGDFRINGSPVEGMVDTGATFIAMNMSTARRLGVAPGTGEFTHPVSTANGQTHAAKVRLQTVEIGPVRVRGVDAFVLQDTNLSMTLIGMSFMSRLKGYRVENGELLLLN
jgi:aspartyl protease family protein